MKTNNTFYNILICISLIWFILPFSRVIIKESFFLIFNLITCFLISYSYSKLLKFFLISIFLCSLLAFIVSVFHFGFTFQGFISNFTSLQLFFSLSIYAIYIFTNNSINQIKFIFIFITILMTMIFIISLYNYNIDPTIARKLAHFGEEELTVLRLKNIAGYSWCYAFGLLSVLIFNILMNCKISLKFIYIALTVLLYTLFLLAQYTTLLILNTVVLMYMLLINKSKYRYIICFLLILFMIFSKVLLPNILYYTADRVNPTLHYKLTSIADYINYGTESRAIEGRRGVYSWGLEYFLKSPFYGNKINDLSYYDLKGTDVSHSELLGYLVKTGIIGLLLFIYIFQFHLNKILLFIPKNYLKDLMFPAIIYIYLLMLFNTVITSYEVSLIFFLYIPMYIVLHQTYNLKMKIGENINE